MASLSVLESIRGRIAPGKSVRILAFGSSNTERFLPGTHWFDVLEIALLNKYGRFHRCINSGWSGDTTRRLLARFDDQAALYQPHLTIVTAGGNDSNHERGIPAGEFKANLLELRRRFASLGSEVVFQTYYAPDPVREKYLGPFRAYMQIVRDVARETGSYLVDHLPRWEAFQNVHYERYLKLMLDSFHMNQSGNAVFGLDISRWFGAAPPVDQTGFWDEALDIQRCMDDLCGPLSPGK